MVNPNTLSSIIQRKAIGLIVSGIILCLAGITLVITGGIRQKRGSEYTSSIISGGVLSLTGLIILIAGAMSYSKTTNADRTNQHPARNSLSNINLDIRRGGIEIDVQVIEEFQNSSPPKYDYPPKYEDLFPSGPLNSNNSSENPFSINNSEVLNKPEDYIELNNNNNNISTSSLHHINQENNVRDTIINIQERTNQNNSVSILEQIEEFFTQVTLESHLPSSEPPNRHVQIWRY